MKLKQFMSGILAAAMIITSVPAVSVSAAETDIAEGALVASYDFNDETLENSVTAGDEAKAITTGLRDYTGDVVYEEGKDGTSAVCLGDYGLELNKDNLGETFTVSMWMQAEGRISNNQSVLFLGYNNPELWYALAGRDSNNGIKIWAKGGAYNWTEFGVLPMANDWHNVTITDDGETITTYMDGAVIAANDTSSPLSGANQDIYVGVTYWDPEYTGLVDDVKVYNVALTQEQVQAQDKDVYEAALQAQLDAITVEDLLGSNESADAVKFNLNLIDTLGGGTVAWTTSNADAITADGTVFNGAETETVTLTATVTSGILEATKEFEFTVVPLDKSSLEELIAKAESLDLSKYTDESVKLLTAVTEAAKQVNKQDIVEIAKEEIYMALSGMKYSDEYMDPFAVIDATYPAEEVYMGTPGPIDFINIPDSIKDMITVEYDVSDESTAIYEDGVVTFLKDGRVTVTAMVTAKYNSHVKEYSTMYLYDSSMSMMNAASAQNDTLLAAETEQEKEDILTEPTEGPLYIRESSIKQQLTGDLELPTSIDGMEADIEYSVDRADADYVTLEDNTLKITRPYAGEGNYTFILTADIYTEDDVISQQFPMIIAEGISGDTLAGYVYLCFGNQNGADVQQVHMFLSEDGLNWTALNGFNPIFEAGSDYADLIENAGTHNYTIVDGVDISETTSGDASVLFPFEGDDQGIRDPYILRGCREDDKDKIWILATDLNTMSSQYGGNLNNNVVGNWGTMSSRGSTNIFVYETEDFINWERRYIDVGSEIGAGAAWAPEAVYNPEKDNYLVYWSCRVEVDGRARNRVYCNETEDFITFGPTKLYEQEDNYADWGRQLSGNDGYGNIDTSQLWVADEDGNPYGTLFRVVKDETDNHIELQYAETVLNPDVDYDDTEPTRITPYTFDGVERATLSDLSGLNDYQKAEVVWNWFKDESTGDHFEPISQAYMESRNETNGAFEGATMFKFNDRDEWCVMIDNYSSSSIRYEPYVTTDLSEPDSITKVTSGYGRTGGDVGCHGGMMPITAAEYNTLIDAYNSDPSVDNYHPIDYIEVDKRPLEDMKASIDEKLAEADLDEDAKKILEDARVQVEAMLTMSIADADIVADLQEQVDGYTDTTELPVSEDVISLKSKENVAVASAEGQLEWYSADEEVATVENGVITGVGAGSTFVFVRASETVLAKIPVMVDGTLPYEDVTEADWFYDSVAFTYYKNIMTGMDATHFGPYGQLSRAQFALMLYRMEGSPAVVTGKKFNDIAGNEWYGQAVLWAAENGIVTGYENGCFGPADMITREQIAVMMYRYVKYLEFPGMFSELNRFTDAASVSPFAVEAVKWAVGEHIISGKENGTKLDPQGNTTRCEAAAIIQRYMDEYSGLIENRS